ncbi:uncharacterized protein DFL_000727 [Arthrobotrys flagrans]|uniref:HTH La-type RNA-binding domain-containing protein n=1 Tax=Arthrobotrys flagrans TaxID=97331 RepID=A0A437AES5_ARTFL|nr:hypothetical protein DFL_000727 [Arthrobotrys flagrans]
MTDINPEEPVQAPAVVEEKPIEAVAEEKKDVAEEKTTTPEKKERVGIVSDASLLPESDDPKEIIKQVEFYFADSNLRFDKFLYGLVGEENKWVDIALVAGFNRMRRFKNLDNVKKALEDSELMELNEEKTKMRRKNAMVVLKDPKLVDKAITRSVYAKGFGAETKTSQFDIEKFFEKTGITINAVRLRRDDDKVFKGSVFVEFKTVEDMKKFMELEDKPEWNGQKMALIDPKTEPNTDKEGKTTAEQAIAEASEGLKYMTKQDFVEMKMAAIKDGKIQAKNYAKTPKFDAFKQEGGSSAGGRGGRREGRGGRDNRDWRERRDDDRKNGFRGGRGGGRGGRGGRGRDNRGRGRDHKGGDNSGPKLRADGVPIVRATSASPERRSKKRSRDDGAEADASDDKKRRTEGPTDASA